jgi:transcriptional regulator with XRE-family HTH domain
MTTPPPPRTWVELRVLREKDGHSLTSLARAADMSLGYLSDLENGKREPNARMIKKLAVALNVPVSMLEKHRRDEQVPA